MTLVFAFRLRRICLISRWVILCITWSVPPGLNLAKFAPSSDGLPRRTWQNWAAVRPAIHCRLRMTICFGLRTRPQATILWCRICAGSYSYPVYCKDRGIVTLHIGLIGTHQRFIERYHPEPLLFPKIADSQPPLNTPIKNFVPTIADGGLFCMESL